VVLTSGSSYVNSYIIIQSCFIFNVRIIGVVTNVYVVGSIFTVGNCGVRIRYVNIRPLNVLAVSICTVSIHASSVRPVNGSTVGVDLVSILATSVLDVSIRVGNFPAVNVCSVGGFL